MFPILKLCTLSEMSGTVLFVLFLVQLYFILYATIVIWNWVQAYSYYAQ